MAAASNDHLEEEEEEGHHNDNRPSLKKCRLCAALADAGEGVMAFSDEGLVRCLQQHIKKYLYITVTMDDKLTKFVCATCARTLADFHRFALAASQSQRRMIAAVKMATPAEATPPPASSVRFRPTEQLINNDHDYIMIKARPKRVQKAAMTTATHQQQHQDGGDGDEVKMAAAPPSPLVVDSDTHETLEVVVDPSSLYLESSCESEIANEEGVASLRASSPPRRAFALALATDCPHNNNNNNNDDTVDDNMAQSGDEPNLKFKLGEVCACPICGKASASRSNLKLHLRIHRPKGKHECDICKRIFKSSANLARHKFFHARILQFGCAICGRVYATRSTLKAHAITHSDVRPHRCALCDKAFKRNQDLKFHMNQHTGARPYKCVYCARAFASSGNCFSHRKRMHPHEVARDQHAAARMLLLR